MKVCTTIRIVDLVGLAEFAGAVDGAAWFQAARPRVDAADPGLHAIDFAGVRLATVSWLREAVLALQKYTAAIRPDITLIVANVSDLVREELVVALEASNNIIIVASLTSDLEVHEPVLLGRLDPALNETLRVVAHLSVFDASLVSRALPHVGVSAANNRLAALQAKGILKSERRGRSRIYRPIMEELRYGNGHDCEGSEVIRTEAAEMP